MRTRHVPIKSTCRVAKRTPARMATFTINPGREPASLTRHILAPTHICPTFSEGQPSATFHFSCFWFIFIYNTKKEQKLSTTRSAITYVRTLRIATGTRHGTAFSTDQLGNRNFDECDQTCKILQVFQFKTKTLSLTEFRKPRSPEPVPEGNFSRGESQS